MSDQAVNVEVVEDEETREGFLPPSAKANTTLAVQAREDRLLEKVLDSGNIEVLERFIDLRNREEERAAKREFELHFAELQADLEPIKRNKEGDKAKYAPLESMQRKFGPIISRHGFAFWWDERPIEDGGIRITMTISGYGHSITSQKDLPAYTPDKGNSSGRPIMNALQAEGTRSSYGRRYTFKAGFGIAEEDEDTDGFTMGVGSQYTEEILQINSCGTLQELNATWQNVHEKVKNIPGALKFLVTVKNERQKELRSGR